MMSEVESEAHHTLGVLRRAPCEPQGGSRPVAPKPACLTCGLSEPTTFVLARHGRVEYRKNSPLFIFDGWGEDTQDQFFHQECLVGLVETTDKCAKCSFQFYPEESAYDLGNHVWVHWACVVGEPT